MKSVLSIAGSDPSGGAGLQADLKTFLANGVYGMAVPTSLTAQNTMGVRSVLPLPSDFFCEELTCVFEDIPPNAVKVGMLYSADVAKACAKVLEEFGQGNIVVDPVFLSTSGKKLLEEEAREALIYNIFPLASLLTPNIPEAEAISGMQISTVGEMEKAAKKIYSSFGCAVLVKGGHLKGGGADDLLFNKEGVRIFRGERADNKNTHGTGCTLSSAIAANLAKGFSLEEAVSLAKEYVAGAIKAGLWLGHGRGPMDHAFELSGRFLK